MSNWIDSEAISEMRGLKMEEVKRGVRSSVLNTLSWGFL